MRPWSIQSVADFLFRSGRFIMSSSKKFEAVYLNMPKHLLTRLQFLYLGNNATRITRGESRACKNEGIVGNSRCVWHLEPHQVPEPPKRYIFDPHRVEHHAVEEHLRCWRPSKIYFDILELPFYLKLYSNLASNNMKIRTSKWKDICPPGEFWAKTQRKVRIREFLF